MDSTLKSKFEIMFFQFLNTIHDKFPNHKAIQVYRTNKERLNIEKLMSEFHDKTKPFIKAIQEQDNNLFEFPNEHHWFKGIDIASLYRELEEPKEQETIWMYIHVFTILAHPDNKEIQKSLKSKILKDENPQNPVNMIQNMLSGVLGKEGISEMFESVCDQITDEENPVNADEILNILPKGKTANLFQEMLKDVTSELKNTKLKKGGSKIEMKDLFNPATISRIGEKYHKKMQSGEINLQSMMQDLLKTAGDAGLDPSLLNKLSNTNGTTTFNPNMMNELLSGAGLNPQMLSQMMGATGINPQMVNATLGKNKNLRKFRRKLKKKTKK